jgi:hypothetical protein
MLQLGGLPQWCPPSQALQWQEQPDPALASDARIADHSSVGEHERISTYADFTILRRTVEIKKATRP